MLSMCAGDFEEALSRPEFAGSFDAVATCFFLDTAPNVVQYVQVVHRVLKVREGEGWIGVCLCW